MIKRYVVASTRNVYKLLTFFLLNLTAHAHTVNPIACSTTFLNFLSVENVADRPEGTSPIIEVYRRMIHAVQRLSPDQLVEMLATRSYFSLPNPQSSLGDILQNGLSRLEHFALNQNGITLQDLEPHLRLELQHRISTNQIEEARAAETIQNERDILLNIRIKSPEGIGDHLVFSPVGNLAAIDRYKFVDIIDRRTGVLSQLGRKTDAVSDLKFSSDGKYLLREGLAWTAIYEVQTGALVFQSPRKDSVYFRPGYNEIIEFTSTEIRSRVLPSGKILRKSRVLAEKSIQIDPSGQYAVFYDSLKSSVLLWDLKGWRLHSKVLRNGNIKSYGFSATGKYFFIIDGSSQIRIIDTKSGQLIRTYHQCSNIIFSPGDTYFATSFRRLSIRDKARVITIHNSQSNETILSVSHSSVEPLLSFSYDERYLFVGSNYKHKNTFFRLYELSSKHRLIQVTTKPDAFEQALLSPNKRNLILFLNCGRYLVYSIAENRKILASKISYDIDDIRGGSWTLSFDGEFAGFRSNLITDSTTYFLNVKRLWEELGD